jgi:hypothetical protein
MKIDNPAEWLLVAFTALLFVATGGLVYATVQLVHATDRLADIEERHGEGHYSLVHLQVDLNSRTWNIVVANSGLRDVGITSIRAGAAGQTSTHSLQLNEEPLRQGEVRSFSVPASADEILATCCDFGFLTAQLWINATSGPLNREFTRPCNGASSVIEFYADGVSLDGR